MTLLLFRDNGCLLSQNCMQSTHYFLVSRPTFSFMRSRIRLCLSHFVHTLKTLVCYCQKTHLTERIHMKHTAASERKK